MPKRYDLEERTEAFAKAVIAVSKTLPKNTINNELISQVIRSTGSTGANYIEANDNLGKKDFTHRIRICRKEAKESRYWFKLIMAANPDFEAQSAGLIQEATELMNIFGAILKKTV